MSSVSITFKNLRHFPSLSEETMCYQATVYIDGKRVGTIENRGTGGCSNLSPSDKSDATLALIQKAKAFARNQTWTCAGTTGTYELLEDYIDALAGDEAERQRCRRALKGRTLLILNGQVCEVKAKASPQVFEALRKRYGKDITILNDMPVEEAVDLYVRQLAESQPGSGA